MRSAWRKSPGVARRQSPRTDVQPHATTRPRSADVPGGKRRGVRAASPTKTMTRSPEEATLTAWTTEELTRIGSAEELDAVDRDKRRYSPHTLDRITRPAARSTIIELIPC